MSKHSIKMILLAAGLSAFGSLCARDLSYCPASFVKATDINGVEGFLVDYVTLIPKATVIPFHSAMWFQDRRVIGCLYKASEAVDGEDPTAFLTSTSTTEILAEDSAPLPNWQIDEDSSAFCTIEGNSRACPFIKTGS